MTDGSTTNGVTGITYLSKVRRGALCDQLEIECSLSLSVIGGGSCLAGLARTPRRTLHPTL